MLKKSLPRRHGSTSGASTAGLRYLDMQLIRVRVAMRGVSGCFHGGTAWAFRGFDFHALRQGGRGSPRLLPSAAGLATRPACKRLSQDYQLATQLPVAGHKLNSKSHAPIHQYFEFLRTSALSNSAQKHIGAKSKAKHLQIGTLLGGRLQKPSWARAFAGTKRGRGWQFWVPSTDRGD